MGGGGGRRRRGGGGGRRSIERHLSQKNLDPNYPPLPYRSPVFVDEPIISPPSPLDLYSLFSISHSRSYDDVPQIAALGFFLSSVVVVVVVDLRTYVLSIVSRCVGGEPIKTYLFPTVPPSSSTEPSYHIGISPSLPFSISNHFPISHQSRSRSHV